MSGKFIRFSVSAVFVFFVFSLVSCGTYWYKRSSYKPKHAYMKPLPPPPKPLRFASKSAFKPLPPPPPAKPPKPKKTSKPAKKASKPLPPPKHPPVFFNESSGSVMVAD